MRDTLKLFTNSSSSLYEASEALLNKLGIQYSPLLRGNSFNDYFEQNDFTFQYVEEVNKCIDQIWNIGYVNDTTFQNTAPSEENAKYFGLSIFACEIKPEAKFPRSSAVVLTRAFNRISTQKVNNAFDMPVIVIMRQGAMLSLATCERSDRKDGNGEKVGKVTILRDMNCKQLHAGHRQILERIKENVRGCKSYEDLYQKWFESFDIEILSEDFFKKYKSTYEDIVEHITDKRMKNSNSKGVEVDNENPCKEIMSKFACFDNPEKAVRDYVKKLMGRLVFIQFLQKKGWMGVPAGESWNGGDPEFLQNIFHQSEHKEDFVDKVLAPLFNDLNTRRENDLVSSAEVSLGKHIKVPYLNGGLFEVSDSDNLDFKLPSAFFWNTDEEAAKKNPGILRLFANYNFTIDENAPDNVEVAVDPEMLGHIFENLLEDNKDKGAFYTPKGIVQYMCRESLIAYLQTDVNDDQTKDAIRQFVTTYDVPERLKELKESVSQKLKDVKICDPAIGSGAFPMGLLRELYACRKAIEGTNEETAVSIKKHIIQNNIYGVDIEKGAVDIARLRFWLALIVDAKNPYALPNMDFKIMQGNSLLEQYEGVELSGMSLNEQAQKKTKRGQAWQQSIAFDEQDSLKNIQDAIRKYYNTDEHGKKVELRNIINNNVKSYIINLKGCSKDIKKKLKALPIPNDQFFLWHIYFKEVFDNGGFDIIIGNPPYVGEKKHKYLFRPIRNSSLGKYYLGKMDYFYFFFHLAFNMLSSNGVATFITTNYYPTALGARKLRSDIKERLNVKILFNLGELLLFKNAPGQHNMISSFSKGEDRCKCQIIDVHKKGALNPLMFASIINHKDEDTIYAELAQEDLYDGEENYIRFQNGDTNNPQSILLDKILKGNEILGNIANVNTGIMGGCDSITNHNMEYADADYIRRNDIRKDDGVFVLDCSYFRDSDTIHLIQNYPFYKDFYKNSDISRYRTNEITTKRLMFSSSDTPLSEQEIIKSCLSKYQPILTRIREINNENTEYWHQLRRGTAHPHIFKCAKIVCPQRSKTNTFGYNECDWYAASDVFYITKPQNGYNIKYILGLLNSRLYYFWLYNKGKKKGENLELTAKPLSEIPIKKAPSDIQNRVVEIIDKIIDLKKINQDYDTSSLERTIDFIVYELYGLTNAEIRMIDPNERIIGSDEDLFKA